jgi:hypothetical protein
MSFMISATEMIVVSSTSRFPKESFLAKNEEISFHPVLPEFSMFTSNN